MAARIIEDVAQSKDMKIMGKITQLLKRRMPLQHNKNKVTRKLVVPTQKTICKRIV